MAPDDSEGEEIKQEPRVEDRGSETESVRSVSAATLAVENGRARDPQRGPGIFELSDDEHNDLLRTVQAEQARLRSLRRTNRTAHASPGEAMEASTERSGTETPLSRRIPSSPAPQNVDFGVSTIGETLESLDRMATEAAAVVNQYEQLYGRDDGVADGYVAANEGLDSGSEVQADEKTEPLQ